MTRKYRAFRLPTLLWAITLAWGLLAAPLWAADTEAGPDATEETVTTEESVPAQAPKARPAPERRDEVFGTMDENIRMDRDPQTGDSVISVTPTPKPRQQYNMPPVTVEPRVQVPARNRREYQGRHERGRSWPRRSNQ